jgi:carboxyl-terminal processing protease
MDQNKQLMKSVVIVLFIYIFLILEPMKRTGIFLMLLIAGWALLPSCKKEEPVISEETRIINNWIWDGMNDVYLWEKYIPDMDPDIQPDPEAFFYDLLYEEDRYSWITDDYQALEDMFEGIELATGMSARPGLITDTRVISIVEYVTPDSPASDSGISRGDIIYRIDNQDLNRDNYYSLYNQTTATFAFATWNGSEVVPDGRSISLTRIELNQNPVVHREVIEYEGSKVGYMVYTQFTSGKSGEWRTELEGVFEEFRSAGVSDVVMDLRYNPGGSLDLAAYLASTLGPYSAMNDRETFVDLIWNDYYNDFWKEYDLNDDGSPDGEDSEQLVIRLPQSDFNMDLSRVYFLTTDVTASGSESLITGLYPYTEVVQIGDTTYGKCYGSITIEDTEEPKRHSWAMQPIVLKYTNAEGFTDFVDGLVPDIPLQENLLYARPFGSLDDPLLAAALEDITGVPVIRKKALAPEAVFRALPPPRNTMVERMTGWPGAHPEVDRY